MAFMCPEIAGYFNKLKPPYNISSINQKAALKKAGNTDEYRDQIKIIKEERERVAGELRKLDIIDYVFPSDANFLLVKVKDAGLIYKQLAEKNIIVRNRSNAVENCLRITIGSRNENDSLISALQGRTTLTEKGRRARVERITSETSIIMEIDLDGTGKETITTGIGFFDHMLKQIACHGNFDLMIEAKGDLDSDEHHLIEDVGIVLGEAILKATGSKKGIERYGFLLPMDDSLAQVAIDFGGRPWLVWNATFEREKIGEMPTEMFFHFFKSFCDSAKCNLNIKAEGINEHHKIEAIFKAFAKVLRMAVKQSDNYNLPTTKGSL
jgi:imidazoleglycerol phosphate dehydratase HisB